ncbi:MAG: hypothetical protein WBP64_05740 [Nitrososphaeraceae archaeon]
MRSTLNLNRISCKACLSVGRLSINDRVDNDDTEGTATQALSAIFQKLDARGAKTRFLVN